MQLRYIHKECHSGQCVVRAPVWAKSIAVLMKPCFTNWFKNLLDTLLYQSVFNGRNTKRALFPVILFYFHSADRVWPEII